MISALNTQPTFCGETKLRKVKRKIQEAKVTKDEVIAGTLGAGATAGITKLTKLLTTMKMFTQKTQALAGEAVQTVKKGVLSFAGLKKTFLGLKDAKIIKPFVNMASTPIAKKVFGTFGAISAATICVTEASHIINTGAKLLDKSEFDLSI